MKKILLSFAIFLGLVMFNSAYAADSVNINLKIYAGDNVLFDGPKTVTAFPESPAIDAPITINGKCAVGQSGLSNTWTWNYAPSGWLDELGGYTTSSDFSKVWNYFVNLTYGHGSDALNQYQPSDNEELLLAYDSFPLRLEASKTSGVVDDTITFTVEENGFDSSFNSVWTLSEGATVTLGAETCATDALGTCSLVLNTAGSLKAIGSKTLHVPSAGEDIEISAKPIISGSGRGRYIPPTFNVQNALAYLKSEQSSNGSFGESLLYTDWAAIALEAGSITGNSRDILLAYLTSQNSISSLLTDNVRRAMALLALGQNPYSFNGVNYINAIINSFDGTQFGNAKLVNDDIFALIPLASSGYTSNDDIISKDI